MRRSREPLPARPPEPATRDLGEPLPDSALLPELVASRESPVGSSVSPSPLGPPPVSSAITPRPGELDLGELTLDSIRRGRLHLYQPRVGYRFSIDPLLLADFVGPPPLGRLVDLGAGCGIVGLTLGQMDETAQITLVELQGRYAALCQKNAAHNGLSGRCAVVQGDLLDPSLRQRLPGAWFDLVVSCPPYYPLGQGGVNPDSEEAVARHELRLPLPDLVRAARRLIGFRGRVALVYPSPRLPELLANLMSVGLTPTRLRLIHPREGEPAQRALVEARKGARASLLIEPPLYVRTPDGAYSAEARRALGEPPAGDAGPPAETKQG